MSIAVNVLHKLPDTLWAELLYNETAYDVDPFDALTEILALQRINKEDDEQDTARQQAYEAWQAANAAALAEREAELEGG